MAREIFSKRRFTAASLTLIEQANDIIAEYQAQGFTLTNRQLFYQFVARGFLDNALQNYARVNTAMRNGRDAGLVDWDHRGSVTRTAALSQLDLTRSRHCQCQSKVCGRSVARPTPRGLDRKRCTARGHRTGLRGVRRTASRPPRQPFADRDL